jgi:hypothetical protein
MPTLDLFAGIVLAILVIFRLYGPTTAFFDKSWKPSDIEKIK